MTERLAPKQRIALARLRMLQLLHSVTRPLTAQEINQFSRGPRMKIDERRALLAVMVKDGTLEETTIPGTVHHGGSWSWVDKKPVFTPDPIPAYRPAGLADAVPGHP